MSNDHPTSPPDGGRPVPPPPPPPPAGVDPVEPFAVPDRPFGTPASPYGGSPYGAPASFGAPGQAAGAPTYGAPTYGAPTYGTPTYGTPTYAAPTYATSADGSAANATSTDGPRTDEPYGTLPTYLPADAVPPAQPPRRSGAALSALILGVVSLLLGWMSQATGVAVPVAALALVVGLVVAVRTRRRGSRGAGPAVTGVVLAVLAMAMVGARSADGPADVGVVPSAEDLALPEGMGGDGSQDVAVPPWQPLTVTDVAFGPEPDDPGAWWYVVMLDNPNPAHRFDFAEMTVEALAADGTLIAARSEYAPVLPGQVAVAGTFYDLGGYELDRVDVRLPVLQDVTYAPEGGALTAADVTGAASSWGVTVTGTVTSTLEEDAEMVRVVVVATTPDGEVLGSAHGYVDELPAGGDGEFEADFFVELPAGTRYTAYATT